MPRLFPVFYSLVASTLAGVGVVIALVSGVAQLVPLIGAAVLGAAVAAPVTWIVARRMDGG